VPEHHHFPLLFTWSRISVAWELESGRANLGVPKESSLEFRYCSCILSLFRLRYNTSYLSILPFKSITFGFYFALEALLLVQTKVSLVLVSIALFNLVVLWSFFA
jgi:hypothetical protein